MRWVTETEILSAIATIPDEASQIDTIMAMRRCFRPQKDDEFYAIIQDYLTNNLDVALVTRKLLAPIDAAIQANKKEPSTYSLWYPIIHSAKRLPFRDTAGLDKLIALMRAIQSSSPPPNTTEPDMYRHLLHFSMCARETMNDAPGCGCGYLPQEVHAYTNMLYFYALLTRPDVFTFWIYCIWTMRDALETPHVDDDPEDVSTPGTAFEKYNAFVPAAAVWIFALGKQIYEREEDLTPENPHQGDPGRGGALWKGRAEFSRERWGLWRKRFGEVAGMEGVSAECRGVAREAEVAMGEIERA
ncbi:ras GTPase activating [Pyrenophora seminiperda CCB06]|uniref:Ras GTPase activating n=1 Tax=Pyrenophora seminiperda CCB06 TaxID=1302712 RepID=A0A3M7LXZ9_9PLEO|nr:ras GTPase activating [Pyrenophora seminiperda CCB06]